MNPADDIIKKIELDFNISSQPIVKHKMLELYKTELNVGPSQLARSLLHLSNGNLKEFLSFFPISDPRDILEQAGRGVYDYEFKY